jgi:hypothetical protein
MVSARARAREVMVKERTAGKPVESRERMPCLLRNKG